MALLLCGAAALPVVEEDAEDNLPAGYYLPAVRIRFHPPPPPPAGENDKPSFRGDDSEQFRNLLGPGLRDDIASLSPMVDLPAAERMASFAAESSSSASSSTKTTTARTSATTTTTPDLRLWRLITPVEGVSVMSLLHAAQEDPAVDVAELAPAPVEAPDLPGWLATRLYESKNQGKKLAPDLRTKQGYLNRAPTGIDAYAAWNQWGGTGRFITVYDIEYNWNPNHEDADNVLPTNILLPPGATIYDPFSSTDHGTAVMSEVVGEHNSHGVKGISYNARYKFSPSYIRDSRGNLQFSVGAAIVRAAADGRAGDVILVEAQVSACGLDDYGPVEWNQFEFDAIRAATNKGIVVVEAAGNGGVDLDQSGCLGRFNRDVRDSGAIIVGAGASSSAFTPRERKFYSCYGERVDVQGWGEDVFAAAYGDEFYDPDDPNNSNRWYTSRFGGTSSASPIVAGAVACLQGIEKFRSFGRSVFSPEYVRDVSIVVCLKRDACALKLTLIALLGVC